jgi:IS5 family transposase
MILLSSHYVTEYLDRSAASRRYEKRSGYTIRSLKTTLLVDVESLAILDVHCSTGKPHDTQIGWQVVKRNRKNAAMEVLLGDKGYDWSDLRDRCRSAGIRPVIKHREFTSLDKAHNARLDDDLYAQRAKVETAFSVLKRRLRKTVRARSWSGQFREIPCRCVVYNVDRALNEENPTPSGV